MTIKIDGFEKLVSFGKDNADALAKSGAIAVKGFEEIAKVQQSLVAEGVKKADAAVKALFSVKSPTELADLQGKLARETLETAIADGRKLAELSTSALTAAFEPIQARFAALTKTAA